MSIKTIWKEILSTVQKSNVNQKKKRNQKSVSSINQINQSNRFDHDNFGKILLWFEYKSR